MKRIYRIFAAATLLAACLPVCASARETLQNVPVPSGLDCSGHELYDLLTAPGMKGAERVSEMAKASGAMVISSVPETAEGQLMERDASGFFVAANQTYVSNVFGISLNLYTDGDDVYFRNPCHQFTVNTYIKGTKYDDRMIFNLPQAIYTQSGSGVYYCKVLRFNEQAQWYLPSDDDAEFSLILNEEGKYEYDCDGYTRITNPATGDYSDFPNRIIGVVDEYGEWQGYGDFYYRISPFSEETVEGPASAQTQGRNFIYGVTGHEIEAAIDGSDIYLRGVSRYLPDAWVKGRVEGTKVTFPSGQYLGISNYLGYYAYLNALDVTYTKDPDTGSDIQHVEVLSEMVFDYDESTGKLTALYDLCVCGGSQAKAYLEYFPMPEIRVASEDMSKTPMAPIIGRYMNQVDENEPGVIYFDLPTISTSGDLLAPASMEWCFLIDGELFSLDPSDYLKLDEEMEWIPYYYYDGFDIGYSGTLHQLYFYVEAPETLGIQSRYTDQDGIVYYSEKAMVDATVGIDSVVGEHHGVKDVVFYDITGAVAKAGSKGILIKVVRYVDGTAKAEKIVVL